MVPRHTLPFALKPLLALLAAATASTLNANPQTPQVVNGQATFAQTGKSLTVTNTPGAIINWQQFNIDRGELTRFVQQNAASQVLNRVVGVNPSAILGALQSNGRVFLVNPNGIVFGAGSQVDVAGFVASTLKISNDDFLNNRLRFGDTPGAGGISNAGTLTSATGGNILLVAPKIENSGLIHAPDGKILLAAGRSVEVADIDRPSIQVEITNTDEQAVNLGTLMARHISIYGGLIRNSGRIQASSAVMGDNGKIILQAKQRVVLEPTSVIEATGSQGTTGGTVSITAQNSLGLADGGAVLVQGLVSTRPLPTGMANNVEQNQPLELAAIAQLAIKKESIRGRTSATVAPMPDALSAPAAPLPELVAANSLHDPLPAAANGIGPSQPDPVSNPGAPPPPARPAPSVPALPVNPASPSAPASPAGGNGVGGSIRISAGGRVEVGDGARLDASGTYGGGEILVGGGWQGLNPNIINSQFTYIASTATLYANAQTQGNGGLVVVWADDTARVHGQIAAKGGAQGGDGGYIETSGKRFLDVTRAANASAPMGKGGQWLLDPNSITISGGVNTNVDGSFTSTDDGSIISATTLGAALTNGTNVTVTTSSAGANAEAGDITLSINLTASLGSAEKATLTLNAQNNIVLSGDISSGGADRKLNLVLNAGGGSVTLGSTLALNGGTLSVNAGTVLTSSGGVLDGVVLGSDLTMSGTFNIANSLKLVDGITVNKGSGNWNWVTTGQQDLATISGSAIINSSGGYVILGSVAGQTINIGAGLTVQGIFNLVGNGYGADGHLVNNGDIVASSGESNIGFANLTNNATVRASGGALHIYVDSFNSNGMLRVGSNSLIELVDASRVINAGSMIDLQTGGHLGLSGNYTLPSLTALLAPTALNRATGSWLHLSGTLDLASGTLDIGSGGVFGTGGLTSLSGTVNNGTLVSGDGTVLNGSQFTLDGITLGSNLTMNGNILIANSLKLVDGITVNVEYSSLYWVTTGLQDLTTVSGNATINANNSEIRVGMGVAGQTVTIGSGIALQGAVVIYESNPTAVINNGKLLLSGGAISVSNFINASSGLVEVSGSVTIDPFTAFSNSGELRLTSQNWLTYQANLTNDGSISGNGNLDLGGVYTLTNNGIIAPGTITTPIGTISIDGGLDLGAGGTVLADLNGNTYGNFDTLAVTGNVNYGGTLSLSGLARGGTISVVTSGTRTSNSTFATINGSLTGLTPIYSATDMALAFGTASQWSGMGDGFTWADLDNWSNHAVPGPLDDVIVATPGPDLLIFYHLPQSVNSLTTVIGRGLRISAGDSLTLAQPSTIGGNLVLGGYVRGTGTLAVLGALNVIPGTSTLELPTTVAGLTTLGAGSNLWLTPAATLTVGGGMNWSGGPLLGTGTLRVPVGQTFTMTGSALGMQPNLENFGTTVLNLDSGASLTMAGGGNALANSGTLIFAGDGNGLVGGFNLISTGTISKTGTGVSSILGPVILDSTNGTFSNTGGGSLNLWGTVSNFVGTTTFSGSNINLQSMVSADFADGSVINGPLNITMGNASFGNTTINGSVNYTGGTVALPTSKTLTVAAGGSLSIGAGRALTDFGTLVNEGTVTLNGSAFAPTFINRGNMTLNGVNHFDLSGFTQEAGTLTLTTAGALTKAGSIMVWSGGALSGVSGGLSLTGPAADLVFAGTGQRVLNGYDLTVNNLTLSGGSLNVQTGSLTLNGNTTLATGSNLSLAGGNLTNNGSLALDGLLDLRSGTFVSNGAITTAGSGSMLMAGDATLTVSGTGQITNTTALVLANRTITNPIDNLGTIQMDAGLIFSQPVNNSGTMVAAAGSNTQFNAGLAQSSGASLILSGGGSVTGNVNLNGGILMGTGTIHGNVTIGTATLAPGFSPGAITINGNLTLNPASVLNLELGGPVQGSGYDWVNVTGTAALDGTLNVSSFASYAPLAGTSFTVMNFANMTGAFTSTVQPVGWGLSYLLGSTSYALQAPAAPVVVAPPVAPAPAPVVPVIPPVVPAPTPVVPIIPPVVPPVVPAPVPGVTTPDALIDWNVIEDRQPSLVQGESLRSLFDRLERAVTAQEVSQVVPKKLVSVQKMLEEEGCP